MKNKKNNKKRLSSLILLLVLTIAMLSVATYAWFTSNRSVKVSSINVEVTASEGFQISVDGVNWKSVITQADIIGATSSYTNHTNHVSNIMVPVSTAATKSDATTGFLDFYLGSVTTNAEGHYVLTASKIVEATTTGQFTGFDLFFRTNSLMDLILDQEAGVTDIATVNTRQGRGMENSARIAFVDHGNISPTSNPNPTGAEVQQLKSTAVDGSNIKIWEPNYKSHTQESKIEAYNMYGISSTSTIYDNWITYSGVSAEIPEANAVLLPQATAAANATYFTEMLENPMFVKTEKNASAPTSLGMQLQPGITKMRIYMWLEGQDYDCGDSASGSDIAFNLFLSASKVATP